MTRFICNAHAIMPDMKGYEDIVSGYSGRFNTTAAKGRISVMRGERNGIFDFYEKVESEAGKILYIHNKDSEGEIFYEAEREDGNGEKFKDVVLRIPYQKGKVRGYFKSFTDSNGTHYEIEFNARGQLIVSKSTYKDVKGVTYHSTYDAGGNLVEDYCTWTDENGVKHSEIYKDSALQKATLSYMDKQQALHSEVYDAKRKLVTHKVRMTDKKVKFDLRRNKFLAFLLMLDVSNIGRLGKVSNWIVTDHREKVNTQLHLVRRSPTVSPEEKRIKLRQIAAQYHAESNIEARNFQVGVALKKYLPSGMGSK